MNEARKMTSNTVPHLCGGILFDLLLEARKTRSKSRNKLNGGSDGLTIPNIYAGLIKIITGDDLSKCAGSTFKKCATQYRKCKDSTGEYVPFTNAATQSSFDSLYKTNKLCLLERTAEFIEKYLNKDKCAWLVSALIETMQQDVAVSDDIAIAINYNAEVSVSQLHTEKTIIFLPFMLSVLYYVLLNCSDCESGEATFNAWYSQTSTHSEWKFSSDIGSKTSPIDVITDLTIPASADMECSQKNDYYNVIDTTSTASKITVSSLDSGNNKNHKENRQKQKKQDFPKEDPVVENTYFDNDIANDNSTENSPSPTVVHQTIVNQYGDHPLHIDHVENLTL